MVQTVWIPLVGFCRTLLLEADGERDSGRLTVTVSGVLDVAEDMVDPLMSADDAKLLSDVAALPSGLEVLTPVVTALLPEIAALFPDAESEFAEVASGFA